MSKLAHSNQETMDEIDRRRAIENGDEDLIPKDTKPHPEAPRVSEAPLTHDLASILRALAYTHDTMDRVQFTRVAQTFLAEHEHLIGQETFMCAKQRTREIEREQVRKLWELASV